jgi:cytochrome c peroxidase
VPLRPSICHGLPLLVTMACGSGSGGTIEGSPQLNADPGVRQRLMALSPAELPPAPPDPTNAYLADPRAALLGKKLFFDTRFSGPLLDEANNGDPASLGLQGETGKVGCVSCHVPTSGFSDTRSARAQISLGSGWTHRRAKSLLDVAQSQLLNWDGRRDAAFSQPFTPLEDPAELNSSRLFAAQQIVRLYRTDYEAVFGALPALDRYAPVAAADAGCAELSTDMIHGSCVKPGADDSDVTRIVVNMGKAIEAYTRQLGCGPSRFDAWVAGDQSALSADEQAGALLFVGKGACDACHSGPYFSDRFYHNVGLHPDFRFFVAPLEDRGAESGLGAMLADPLNSQGPFSDGYDGRLEKLPSDLSSLAGAFSTPGLRCVARRPSFMHTGQFRSLEDVVSFFDKGGDSDGYPGQSENFPRHLSSSEKAQLVAFLRALDGPGPDAALLQPPELP